MDTTNAPPPVEDIIQEAIAHAGRTVAEPMIQKAVAEFEQALRREVGVAVLEVSRWYSMERYGDTLRIEVRVRGAGTPP